MAISTYQGLAAAASLTSLPIVAIGVANIFRTVIASTGRNPGVRDKIFAIGILGFAVTEAIALFALLVGFLILYTQVQAHQAWAAAAAVSLPLMTVGYGVSKIFTTLIRCSARNPELRDKIFAIGILGFAVTEAIALFALLIAFLILYTPVELHQAYGAVLAIGLPLGAVGYAVAQIFVTLIDSVALNPNARDKVFSIGILGFAVTEAISLFALLVAFLILYTPVEPHQAYGASLAVMFTLPAVGYGVGALFNTLIDAVARNPEARDKAFSIGILGFAVTEAISLFALLVAFLILYT